MCRFLSALIGIACFTSGVHSDDSAKCIVAHLKSLKISDLDLPDLSKSEDVNCAKVIKKAQGKNYKSITVKLAKLKLGSSETDKCVKEELKSQNWAEQSMKQDVYRASDSADSDDTKNKINQIEVQKEKSFKDAMILCKYRELFNTMFDNFSFERLAHKTEKQQTGDNCLRKFVIAKKLLDISLYADAKPSPPETDKNVNCEELVKSISTNFRVLQLETLFDGNNRHGVKLECAGVQNLQLDFFEHWMKLLVLRNFDITDLQKEAEKDQFVNYFVNRMESPYSCQLHHRALQN